MSSPPPRPPLITVNSEDITTAPLIPLPPPHNENVSIALTHNPQTRCLTPVNSNGPSLSTFPTPSPYSNPNPKYTESQDMLLPPSDLNRFQGYNDSPVSSRRSSWSTDEGTIDHLNPFGGAYNNDSTQSFGARSLEPQAMKSISEKFSISPTTADLIMDPAEKEPDDDLHDPGVDEKERGCDLFTKRGVVNVGGLVLLTVGVLVLFIGYPVITYVTDTIRSDNLEECEGPLCLDVEDVPLLKNYRRDLVDPDTPEEAMWKKSADGKKYKLVFSDEFNEDGRTFYPGEDPYWEGVDIHYAATQDLEWYDPDAITTKDGVLEITFDAHTNHNLDYRSGMLQSWNKLCFKGGIIEASISLPGRGDISGLWPGFWTMGNLGRPGYLATTEGMWPYTYHDKCDAGITANQSSPDGISFLPGMKLPACTCSSEDHPNRGKSRSAPEIDALEASVGPIDDAKLNIVGSVSQSAQVAPFDIWYQPNYDQIEVYDPKITTMNNYRGGVFQQALSGLSVLNNDWYDGKQYQKYGFEYEPGEKGMIIWNIGDEKTWRMEAAATGPNGNVGARPVPQEPMTIIVNCGISNSFAAVELAKLAKIMPAKMRIDWIRVWQDPEKESVTCDPEGYPTTRYIMDHPEPYNNPNLTRWEDTGFDWPKNELVDGCD